jgi:hypothetical protein
MAIIGIGAKLEYESGSGWAEVPNVKSVNFPGFNVNPVDTTHLGCADFAKTFMPGTIDADSVSFECEYIASTYTALQGLLREVIGWRVSSPTSHHRRRRDDDPGHDQDDGPAGGVLMDDVLETLRELKSKVKSDDEWKCKCSLQYEEGVWYWDVEAKFKVEVSR